jgi:O-antigen/teichoic acid export membrane protein
MASNILTGFILFPLILKHIGLEALGIFGLLYSAKAIVDIGIGWLSASMTKSLIKYNFLKNKILTLSFLINFSYGIFGFVIFILYGYMVKIDYFMSFFYFSIFFLLSCVMIPFYEMMSAELRQYQIAFFRFLQQFLFMALSIFSFLLMEIKSLDIIFLALVFSSIVTLIFLVRFFYNNFQYKYQFKRFRKKILYQVLIKDGKKYFFNGVSTILLLQLDVLLIDYLYGSKSAGIYLLIWKIPNTLIMLGWRLSEPFQAEVAKKIDQNKAYIKEQFYDLEKKILFASIIAGGTYLFLGSFLLDIWIGNENIPHIAYMYFIPAIVIIFSIMQRFYLTVNYYTKGLQMITNLQLIELFLKIIFIVFAFDKFQELSPILGWLIAFLGTLFFYRRNSLKVIL